MSDSIIKMLLTDNSGASPTGEVAAYAWPGGYPLYYMDSDCETLCPACVNASIKMHVDQTLEGGWHDTVIARDVNWEDTTMVCAECNRPIESAYGEDEGAE